jgi:leucyl aminopeptidase (aminopeptidase T)
MKHVHLFVEEVFKDGARPVATVKAFESEVRTWFAARSSALQQAILREYKSMDELVRTLATGLFQQNKEELAKESPPKKSDKA